MIMHLRIRVKFDERCDGFEGNLHVGVDQIEPLEARTDCMRAPAAERPRSLKFTSKTQSDSKNLSFCGKSLTMIV